MSQVDVFWQVSYEEDTGAEPSFLKLASVEQGNQTTDKDDDMKVKEEQDSFVVPTLFQHGNIDNDSIDDKSDTMMLVPPPSILYLGRSTGKIFRFASASARP